MNQASNPGSGSDASLTKLDFLRSFFRDYRTVGAVRETSRGVARRIAEIASIGQRTRIAEFGCGTGPITDEILRRLPPDGLLWGFEVHDPFIAHLKSSIRDPRFTLFEESAASIVEQRARLEAGRFDAIVSTIPFSFLTPEQTTTILRAAIESLEPDGVFVALQYHPTYLPPFLQEHFHDVERELYVWNLPPATLMRARLPRRTS
jgi:phosphatidylethanolamine/phosphatidyl-N-methylethanolamine N-methyltransferase